MPNDVDAWMAKYDNPQKAVAQAVRKAILAADKRIAETIKWQSPTFMHQGQPRLVQSEGEAVRESDVSHRREDRGQVPVA